MRTNEAHAATLFNPLAWGTGGRAQRTPSMERVGGARRTGRMSWQLVAVISYKKSGELDGLWIKKTRWTLFSLIVVEIHDVRRGSNRLRVEASISDF